MMHTYKVKMGDVVMFPNGIEVNYDETTGSLVVLHPNRSKNITIRQGENSAHLPRGAGRCYRHGRGPVMRRADMEKGVIYAISIGRYDTSPRCGARPRQATEQVPSQGVVEVAEPRG